MPGDPFKQVRAHLAGARQSLARSNTDVLRRRLETVGHHLDPAHLDYRGDAQPARGELQRIVTELEKLTRARPGVATGVDKLTQDGVLTLLPGVDNAISSVKKAINLLKA